MALNTLVGIARQPDAPPASRVAASEAILNRGWGKPTQPVSGDGENPLEVVMRTVYENARN